MDGPLKQSSAQKVIFALWIDVLIWIFVHTHRTRAVLVVNLSFIKKKPKKFVGEEEHFNRHISNLIWIEPSVSLNF